MLRASLGRLLIGINVGLVVLAVICVALAAAARLETLADDQALARVQLAGSTAWKEISKTGEEMQASARLLAERPSIARMLRDEDASALGRYLEQYRSSDRLAGCAVMQDSLIRGRSGASIPWEKIASDPGAGKDQSFIQHFSGGAPILTATSSIPTIPGARVLTAQVLDSTFERSLSGRIGLPVRILDRDTALAREGEPPADLRATSLIDDRPSSGRLVDAEIYLAVFPLHDSAGRPAAVVETILERKAIAASLSDLKRSLAGLAAGVAIVAALMSLVLARRVTRPLEELTGATARIGGGDLTTPIPRVSGREIGALSETMEEMRRRLLNLTAELSRRQAEGEAILGGIVEGVFAVDNQRRIRYLNPQAATLIGISPGEAVGRFCGDVLNPQGPGGVRPCEENCPIIHARFSGSAHATEKLQLAGGLPRTVVITSAAGGEADSRSAGGIDEVRQFQVIRDETEVEAVRRLRDAVLANISHEFKTPLAAQLASIEMLRDRLPELSAAEAQSLVQSLERGTLRLTQLIDNLLESVRIEAGRTSLRRGTVMLDEVIEGAMEMVTPLVVQRGQTLSANLPYPLPPISGDAPRLEQVFVNLLANANKFAPVSSSIKIGGEVGNGEVTLWVEDEGPGPPPGAGTSLFERFVRSPESEDEDEPEQSGMGLGLWIVKSIVERHGGRVEVRPLSAGGGPAEEWPGGPEGRSGTRVCVILPAGRGDEDSGR